MKIKECPNCKSKNLKYIPWLGQIWICRDCGYRGSLISEREINVSRKIQTKKD